MPQRGDPPVGEPAVTPPTIVTPTTPNAIFDVELHYDTLGRIDAIKHPDMDTSWNPNTRRGSWQEYTFNTTSGHDTVSYRRASDAVGETIVASTTYGSTGVPLSLSMPLRNTPRVVSVDRTIDDLGRLSSLRIHEGETNHHHARNITYDDWGFVRSLSRSDLSFSGSFGYDYDDRGRLRRFEVNGSPVTFGYDAAGNLTSQTGLTLASLTLPAFLGATYDGANRLIGWTHDAAGRMTADDEYNYTYNELDQIIDVRQGSWVIAQYVYDAHGQRVREVYDGRVVYSVRGPGHDLLSQETQYLWAKGMRLPERRDFVYHDGVPIAEMILWADGPFAPSYSFRDRLGHPVVSFASRRGLVAEYAEYAPYG